ncbi:hypothetical protein EC991753_1613, partial [Escherichia coli 99.1753]
MVCLSLNYCFVLFILYGQLAKCCIIVAAILFFLDSFTGVSKSEDWSK